MNTQAAANAKRDFAQAIVDLKHAGQDLITYCALSTLNQQLLAVSVAHLEKVLGSIAQPDPVDMAREHKIPGKPQDVTPCPSCGMKRGESDPLGGYCSDSWHKGKR